MQRIVDRSEARSRRKRRQQMSWFELRRVLIPFTNESVRAMNIRLVEKGGPRRLAVIAAIIAALPQLFFPLMLPADYPTGYTLLLAAVLGAFALLVFLLRIEVNAWWGMLIEQALIAGIAACVIHLPMFERSYADPMALVNTACIFLALQLLCFVVVGSCKVVGAVMLTASLIYGVINYEVFMFTENMISFSQILSVRTGMNVVASYPFIFGPFLISTAILYGCAMIALMRIKNVRLGRLHIRAAALAGAAVAAILPLQGYRTMKVTSWKSQAMYSGIGIPLELMLEYKAYNVEVPEGYSPETVAKLATYSGGDEAEAGERPHVIAIMLEAFSDLSVLGDFETDADPLAFTRSLDGESIHGYFLASTFAGGTSRTEWEFLTGNSMFFLSGDCVPFKQYIKDDQNSIVRVFKNAGYHTIGMHCFKGNGWDRARVYPLMGFDETYFEDDLQWDGRVRSFISDSAFVHQVIDLYEANDTGKPLFLFGVTMQNHGDYRDEDFESDVHVLGLEADCAMEDEYLSLVKKSDDALKELIDYFRGVDEPVEIVFFGDHQPRMSGDFYREIGLEQMGQKYIVPYVIWKNHGGMAEETGLTSANYLTVRTAREAGVTMPAYYRFLESLSGEVPAICGLGYQYRGEIYDRETVADEAVAALLNEYGCYQYANMFDDTVDPALYQGAPTEP